MVCLCLCTCAYCLSQDNSSLSDKVFNFPDKFFKKVNTETADLDKQLEKQTAKYIQRLQKKEERLRKKLYKEDSTKAAALFASNPDQQYAALLQKLKTDSAAVFHSMGPEYLPY